MMGPFTFFRSEKAVCLGGQLVTELLERHNGNEFVLVEQLDRPGP